MSAVHEDRAARAPPSGTRTLCDENQNRPPGFKTCRTCARICCRSAWLTWSMPLNEKRRDRTCPLRESRASAHHPVQTERRGTSPDTRRSARVNSPRRGSRRRVPADAGWSVRHRRRGPKYAARGPRSPCGQGSLSRKQKGAHPNPRSSPRPPGRRRRFGWRRPDGKCMRRARPMNRGLTKRAPEIPPSGTRLSMKNRQGTRRSQR